MENAHPVSKMFEAGDWSKTSDYIAADAADHSTPRGDVRGLDSIKGMFNEYGKMMGAMQNETLKELADDDFVMSRMKETWTNKVDDPMMGKAGSRSTMEVIEVTKHNSEGKITDHWSFMSMSDMMKMMPQGNIGMDTSQRN